MLKGDRTNRTSMEQLACTGAFGEWEHYSYSRGVSFEAFGLLRATTTLENEILLEGQMTYLP